MSSEGKDGINCKWVRDPRSHPLKMEDTTVVRKIRTLNY